MWDDNRSTDDQSCLGGAGIYCAHIAFVYASDLNLTITEVHENFKIGAFSGIFTLIGAGLLKCSDPINVIEVEEGSFKIKIQQTL